MVLCQLKFKCADEENCDFLITKWHHWLKINIITKTDQWWYIISNFGIIMQKITNSSLFSKMRQLILVFCGGLEQDQFM